jgi:hypothetical protein
LERAIPELDVGLHPNGEEEVVDGVQVEERVGLLSAGVDRQQRRQVVIVNAMEPLSTHTERKRGA